MEEMCAALCMCICAKKTTFLGKDDQNHSRVGGGIHGEDALSKFSHTATVCVAGISNILFRKSCSIAICMKSIIRNNVSNTELSTIINSVFISSESLFI